MMIIYDKTLIKQIQRSCRFLHNFIAPVFPGMPACMCVCVYIYIPTLYHLNTKEGRLTKSEKREREGEKKRRLNVFVACNNTAETVFVVVVCVC